MKNNIKKANQADQNEEQNFQIHGMRQKQVKMTLQQYLQSVNLKKKIRSRSINRQNALNQQQHNQKNLLQPGFMNNTIEYFKLNQQWKAKNNFNSWIGTLKQLCREYIRNDSHYIQIIRIIDRMTEFVEKEILLIKKDNLLLESYLVTEASYWPLRTGSKLKNNHIEDKNFDQCFQHIPIKKSQFYKSTQKKLEQSHQKQTNKIVALNPQRQNRSSTQPKSNFAYSQKQKNHNNMNNSNTNRTSSTCMKNDLFTSSIESRTDRAKGHKHQIYSFQDKNSQGQKDQKGDHPPNVKQFFHLQQDCDKKNYLNIDRLGLNPIEEQIHRLSLVSKNERNISEHSTRSEIEQNPITEQAYCKIPLRERKYAHKKITTYTNLNQNTQVQTDFNQIFIKLQSPQKQLRPFNNNHLITSEIKSESKIKISAYLQNKQQLKEHSPLISQNRTKKNYDEKIVIETPTTFKRLKYLNLDKQILLNKNISRKGEKANEIKSSRQNIMKRYDTFKNLE